MSNVEDFKAGEERGMLLAEVKALNVSVSELRDSFKEFKLGLGQRTETHGKDIAVMNNRIEVVMTIGKWILAPAFAAVITALMYVIIKRP